MCVYQPGRIEEYLRKREEEEEEGVRGCDQECVCVCVCVCHLCNHRTVSPTWLLCAPDQHTVWFSLKVVVGRVIVLQSIHNLHTIRPVGHEH